MVMMMVMRMMIVMMVAIIMMIMVKVVVIAERGHYPGFKRLEPQVKKAVGEKWYRRCGKAYLR